MRQPKWAAVLPLVAYFNICFFWGTSSVANKLGSSALDPWMVGVVRFWWATALLAVWMLVRRVPFRYTRNDLKVLGIGAFLLYFLNTLLLLLASTRVDASITIVVLCLIPVGMVLVDSLAQRRLQIGRLGLWGTAGGFVGVAVAAGSGILSGRADLVGVALLLCSVAVWCVGTVYLKYRSVSAGFVQQLFLQSAVPAAAFLACAVALGRFHPSQVTWGGALPALYMGVADSIVGLTSYIYLLRRWRTSMVATYAYINPLVGMVLSALVLQEQITPQKVVGMVLVLLSVLLIREDERLRARRED
ncbi:MAG TPA: DMT family transporter [Candidatus Anaerotruncus excrementipullorum]|uniref:DMT family transporter n=1 Tax=Candidatus Anaerotruncus excrementipullorum TaxID=2838465 RepID=A0A9D1WS25_9FIRM|nr:DMT family transporter [Candidatus Anaerotruncus excrementipullorum]